MYAVQMKEICKAFPGVLANDHVTLEVQEGSIHCLLGENGSGKTTLMNVLFGLYHMESGRILMNEKPVSINSPADAEQLGIGMVHQHFMLIPQLTVLENIILGSEPCRFKLNRKKAREQVQKLIDTYHFQLDVNQKVADLSVGMKQRVEILKLLYRKANVIIFDEPTAVLTPQEVEELFLIFHRLVDSGCTVIFITHKLNEIFAVSERVTVLRKGKCVGTAETAKITPEQLSEMMVGRQIEEITQLESVTVGKPVLTLDHVRLMPLAKETVSLQVREREIVGIAGIDGNGQLELEELITGIRKCTQGSLSLCGQPAAQMSVQKRREQGLAYIPSDRMYSGAMGKASIKENFLLGHQERKRYKKHGFVDDKNLSADAKQLAKDYEIKLVNIDQSFEGLSGGNQQKVVLAREVSKDEKLVLAAQPIRGLDIGAIDYVHKTLLRLRSEGKGILLISAELSELLAISDRILVLCDGCITAEFAREEFDEKQIGLAMIGAKEGKLT